MSDQPNWSGRNTSSLAGWINELRCLADHPEIRERFAKSAMRTIANGLERTSGITKMPLDLSIERGPEFERIDSLMDSVLSQMTALPRKGTPAAELTARDKVALALAAGAPYITEMVDNHLTVRTAVPVGIADRGDGGYIIAIGSMYK